ncbi:MAG: hypothetical protein WD552_01595 [Candidatus Paceibacterota bacterium]
MRSTSLVVTLFISAILLAVAHDLVIRLNWYYFYPFTDIPLHVLGGFVIGLFSYLIFSSRRRFRLYDLNSFALLSIIILSTLFVSLLWELVELVFFLTKDAGLSMETLSDIIFGLVGAVISWIAIELIWRTKNTSE